MLPGVAVHVRDAFIDGISVDNVANFRVEERSPAADRDGGPGVICDRGIAAREAAEDETLADVRVSDQRNAERTERSRSSRGRAAARS